MISHEHFIVGVLVDWKRMPWFRAAGSKETRELDRKETPRKSSKPSRREQTARKRLQNLKKRSN